MMKIRYFRNGFVAVVNDKIAERTIAKGHAEKVEEFWVNSSASRVPLDPVDDSSDVQEPVETSPKPKRSRKLKV